jgi:hypothetical protein
MENVMLTTQSAYRPLAAQRALPADSVLGEASTIESGIRPVRPRWFIRWVCLISLFLLCVPALGIVCIASYFYLSSSSQALRGAVMESVPGRWHKHFAINVGGVTVALARFGASFIHLPPDARTALQFLDHGEVGVYEIEDTMSSPDYALILKTADKSMRRRGWERIVSVVEGGQFVAVYAPSRHRGKDISCCVAVLDDWNLVVFSARGSTLPMLEFAQRHLRTTGLVSSR